MTAGPPSRELRLTGSGDSATGYTDTLALNDIHAILTSPTLPSPASAVQDIIAVLARAGRPPYPARSITASVADDPHGLPVAIIDADGTTITISQRHNAPGLQVAITPRDQAHEDALVIAIAGKVIRRPRPRPAGSRGTP